MFKNISTNMQKKFYFCLKISLFFLTLFLKSPPLTAESKPDIQIFVAYHKPFYMIKDEILIPIHVGRDVEQIPSKDGLLTKEEILWLNNNMIGDNTKDNISSKNRYYNELTAMYWMWKNVKTDYIGLFHYRAFLNLTDPYKKTPLPVDTKQPFTERIGITHENIIRAMNENDIIVTKWRTDSTIYNQYVSSHVKSDFDKALQIIEKKYPQMYPFVLKSVKNEDTLYIRNLFICKKELFDEYASWLFDILFELEKQVQDDVLKRDIHQQRIYGFLAERLSTIYFNYKRDNENLKIAYTDTITLEND